MTNIVPLCEHILSIGRTDNIPDIRDRTRFESSLIHYIVGLRFDTDGMDADEISSVHNKLLSVTDI
jgi:hypothetical protein